MKIKSKIRQKLFEIFCDYFLIIFAFCAAFFSRVGNFQSTDFPFFPFLKIAIFFAPIFILLFIFGGLYFLNEKSLFEKLRIIALSNLAGAAGFVLVFFFLREIFFRTAQS